MRKRNVFAGFQNIYKNMSKNALTVIALAMLISGSIISAGCSSPANTTNINASNQPAVVTNVNVSPNGAASPVPTATTAAPINAANSAATAVNKNETTAPPVKEPSPVISSGANDFVTFSQVRAAISADKELLDFIVVDVKNGVVTLSGKAANAEQKAKAAQLAQTVKGIKGIKNNIQVGQ